MKRVYCVAILAVSLSLSVLAADYTTSFTVDEPALSEGGQWVTGLTHGLDWTDVVVQNGYAFGTQPCSSGYNDSLAVLTGSWEPTQTAEATVHVTNQNIGAFPEVELLLRFSIAPHDAHGYEVLFSTRAGGRYAQIVRWNGALNDFTELTDIVPMPMLRDGDVVKATAVGTLIQGFINNILIVSVNDSVFPSGNPGVGFFCSRGTPDLADDFGFYDFTAFDEPPPPPPPPCSYSIAPTFATAPMAATTGTISVTAGVGCAWTATSNATWLTVTSGAAGTGNGSVRYSVAANIAAERTATLTVAALPFTVTQAALTCVYDGVARPAGTTIDISGLTQKQRDALVVKLRAAGWTVTWMKESKKSTFVVHGVCGQ